MTTLRKLMRPRRSDWADIAWAYAYLLSAAWRLFVRRQRLDRWLGDQPVAEKAGPLAQKEQHVVARATRWTNTAARYPFPWARCLQRSLALCLWLEREGIQPELRIGARKDSKGIQAHAWVEYQGHVLNDDESVGEVFSALGTAPPAETDRHPGRGTIRS